MLYVTGPANQGRDLKLKITFSGKLFSIDKNLKLIKALFGSLNWIYIVHYRNVSVN